MLTKCTYLQQYTWIFWSRMCTSQVDLVGKNPPAYAGDVRETGSIPRSGRSLREEHLKPLQYSCLESPTDRGAWWAAVHRVSKSQTWLKGIVTTYIQKKMLNGSVCFHWKFYTILNWRVLPLTKIISEGSMSNHRINKTIFPLVHEILRWYSLHVMCLPD